MTPTSKSSMPRATVRLTESELLVEDVTLVGKNVAVIVGMTVVGLEVAPGVVVFVTNIVENAGAESAGTRR
jgi:hypothetical protein